MKIWRDRIEREIGGGFSMEGTHVSVQVSSVTQSCLTLCDP